MGDSSGEDYYSAPESDKEETGSRGDDTKYGIETLDALSLNDESSLHTDKNAPQDQELPWTDKNLEPSSGAQSNTTDNDSKATVGANLVEADHKGGMPGKQDSQDEEYVSGLDNRFVSDDQEVLEGDKVELSEEQIKELKEKANTLKANGNTHFKEGDYSEAIDCYSKAIELYPPSVCAHEIAVCYANRAACHMKTDNHQAVIDDCTQTLELEPDYMKALLRRAQASEALEKYEDALSDYKRVLGLDPSHTTARQAVGYLPEKIKEQNEKLKDEMLGKLKELGNAILSPFGLSTNNFQMQQDPQTGSYSVNFKK